VSPANCASGYGNTAPANGPTFSQRYHCAHLVCYEHYREISDEIASEKQLKRWRRQKKNALIETLNPQWEDLAADWFDSVEPTGRALTEGKSRDPSTSSG
jgi:hypothetical protein